MHWTHTISWTHRYDTSPALMAYTESLGEMPTYGCCYQRRAIEMTNHESIGSGWVSWCSQRFCKTPMISRTTSKISHLSCGLPQFDLTYLLGSCCCCYNNTYIHVTKVWEDTYTFTAFTGSHSSVYVILLWQCIVWHFSLYSHREQKTFTNPLPSTFCLILIALFEVCIHLKL